MMYLSDITGEKNRNKIEIYTFSYFGHSLTLTPWQSSHGISKSVKIWIQDNFGMENPNLRSKCKMKLYFLKPTKSGGFYRQ